MIHYWLICELGFVESTIIFHLLFRMHCITKYRARGSSLLSECQACAHAQIFLKLLFQDFQVQVDKQILSACKYNIHYYLYKNNINFGKHIHFNECFFIMFGPVTYVRAKNTIYPYGFTPRKKKRKKGGLLVQWIALQLQSSSDSCSYLSWCYCLFGALHVHNVSLWDCEGAPLLSNIAKICKVVDWLFFLLPLGECVCGFFCVWMCVTCVCHKL